MFQKARLKLTVWYLFIIMLICVAFSGFIYNVLTYEYNRILRVEQLRRDKDYMSRRGARIAPPNPEVIQEAKDRLLTILVIINLGILAVSGIAGYFLAGRTLKPIQEMVDEQNRFITDASHELRTPLTSLKSEIEVSLRDKNLNIADYRQLLTSNLEEVNNLQYLSDNLIKLSQYQKAIGVFFEDISLKQVSEEAVKKVTNLAKAKKITIKNKIKDLTIEADKQKLTELLVILLDNAIKYSPKNSTINLVAQIVRNSVILTVSDLGIGIPATEISHLFERFFRGDKSRTKLDIGGYGLGLSIAKQIVDKHHGTIKVTSVVNKGTTFIIQIPLRSTKLFLRLVS